MPRPSRRVPTSQQPRQQQPQRRMRARKPAKAPQRPKLVDIHLRIGLTDELVRFTPESFYKFLTMWVRAGEDVIVRIPKNDHEVNIVLRGTQGGVYRIRDNNTKANIPLADVALAREKIREILDENQDS